MQQTQDFDAVWVEPKDDHMARSPDAVAARHAVAAVSDGIETQAFGDIVVRADADPRRAFQQISIGLLDQDPVSERCRQAEFRCAMDEYLLNLQLCLEQTSRALKPRALSHVP
ncbi:hypothetical protein [Brevundimonas sp. NIBR10]|uniref:hypothetical protein n=1 Tax=Brevundimonas sp. NIBR10 TaxID=3015997 RepID=UPI0022F180AC|nr:hypothetical protein [Brevundimonas sp. NIBR10]